MPELKTYKAKVRRILELHPSARNNDGSLWAYYIQKYKPTLVVDTPHGPAVPLKNFKHLPPSQSIRLARQLIQNDDGEYLPTDPKVKKARNIKEKNIRDAEWCEVKKYNEYGPIGITS